MENFGPVDTYTTTKFCSRCAEELVETEVEQIRPKYSTASGREILTFRKACSKYNSHDSEYDRHTSVYTNREKISLEDLPF